MARQRERGRTIGLNRMAALARIEIRRSSELTGVLVFVTVGAVLKLHFEHSVGSARNVAFFASDFRMRALQRICRCGVIRDRES